MANIPAIKFNIESVTLELTFNSIPEVAPVLSKFEYIEHVQQHLPSALIELYFRDEDTTFIQTSLYDGAIVKVTIADITVDDTKVLALRVLGTPSFSPSQNNEGYFLTISCLLNFPKYFHAVANTGYNGSVSAVLSTLASECGLETQLAQSGDTQFWYTHGRSYSAMVQYLVDHCYLSSTSLPVSCVVHPGIILLKDIFAELKKLPRYELLYKQSFSLKTDEAERKRVKTISDITYTFHDFRSKNIAGVLNASSGYGNTFLQHSVDPAKDFEQSNLKFVRDVTNSELNKKVKSAVQRTDINYLPFNIGNTYPEFYKAYCKNIRFRDLFSNVLEVGSVGVFSKIYPLQNIQVSFDRKFEASKDVTYSGKYICIGKTINILKNIYREKITLANYGRMMNNDDLV